MKAKEIRALISLLDDPDENIYEQVRARLLECGELAIPELESLWEFNDFHASFQERALDIIHKIQFNSVKQNLSAWINDDKDLLHGMYLLSKYQYPDLEKKELTDTIEEIAKPIWLELNNTLTAFEKVKILNHFIFTEQGFTANKKNFHSPQNSYFNEVLSAKKGNPLSLCVLYQLVAEKLQIPIRGVNLPNHFVLCYKDELNTNSYFGDPDSDILFYINAFSNGSIVSRNEINNFLKQLKLTPEPAHFSPCSNQATVKRAINNLIYSYARQGFAEKVEELQELEALFPRDNSSQEVE